MFKQYYADIRRYTKQVHADKCPQLDMHIPITRKLMPLQKTIIKIDTSSTTQFGGEYFFYIEVISIRK